MNPERDAKKKRELQKRAMIISIVALYLGFWFGAEWLYREGDLIQVASHILEDFLHMRPVEMGFIHQVPGFLALLPANPAWVFLAAGVAFFMILSDYINYVINKNTRPGEEHGSATFNTEWEKTEHDCMMSTTIMRQGKEAKLFQEIFRDGNQGADLERLFQGIDVIEKKGGLK